MEATQSGHSFVTARTFALRALVVAAILIVSVSIYSSLVSPESGSQPICLTRDKQGAMRTPNGDLWPRPSLVSFHASAYSAKSTCGTMTTSVSAGNAHFRLDRVAVLPGSPDQRTKTICIGLVNDLAKHSDAKAVDYYPTGMVPKSKSLAPDLAIVVGIRRESRMYAVVYQTYDATVDVSASTAVVQGQRLKPQRAVDMSSGFDWIENLSYQASLAGVGTWGSADDRLASDMVAQITTPLLKDLAHQEALSRGSSPLDAASLKSAEASVYGASPSLPETWLTRAKIDLTLGRMSQAVTDMECAKLLVKVLPASPDATDDIAGFSARFGEIKDVETAEILSKCGAVKYTPGEKPTSHALADGQSLVFYAPSQHGDPSLLGLQASKELSRPWMVREVFVTDTSSFSTTAVVGPPRCQLGVFFDPSRPLFATVSSEKPFDLTVTF